MLSNKYIHAMLLAMVVNSGLQAQQSDIETVRVTGTSVNLGIDEENRQIATIPGGVTLIDGKEMRERHAAILADMLRYVPGVWASGGSCGDCTFFSSRGSNLDAINYDGNGIRMMQDGLPVSGADGNNHNRAVDPLSIHYATVARGANALTYGASTLGGAINFVSPTAHDLSPVELFINGGTHSQVTGRATLSKVFNESFDGLVTIDGKSSNGWRDHQEMTRVGVYTNAGWNLSDDLTTRFYGTYLNSDQELPGALSRAEVAANPKQAKLSERTENGNTQLDVETWRFANRTSWQIDDNSRLDAGVSYEEQALFHPIVDRVMVDFDGPGPMQPVEVFSLLIDTDHKNYNSMLRYNHKVGDHDMLVGVNYGLTAVTGGNHRNLHGERNGLRELVDNDASALEVYLLDRWQLNDRWLLTYGAQFVTGDRELRITTVANGNVRNPQRDYSGVNPRAGVIYALDDQSSLFASVSRLYEAPTTYQLEDNIAGGNATLDPMKGTVVEVGTRGMNEIGSNSGWHWDVALYYAWIQDEILSIDSPTAPGTHLSSNIDETIHAGVEAVFGYSLGLDSTGEHSINPMVSFTLNEFKFNSDPEWGNNRLPVAPEYAIKGELLYRNRNGFFFGPTFDLVGDRYADFANTYDVGSYALLGLRSGWTSEKWKVFAEVRNLLDDDYITNTSADSLSFVTDQILSPGEPLSAYVGLQLSY